jgi:hypothetical protein
MISVKIIDFRKRNYGRETLGFGKAKASRSGSFSNTAISFSCKVTRAHSAQNFTLAKKLKQIHHSYTTTQSYKIFVILSTKTSKFYRRVTQRKAIPFVSAEYDSRENNSHLAKKKAVSTETSNN